jgi:hypothetical protein
MITYHLFVLAVAFSCIPVWMPCLIMPRQAHQLLVMTARHSV